MLCASNEDTAAEAEYDDELLREHGVLLTQSAIRSAIDTLGLVDMELDLLRHADEIDHRPGEGAPPVNEEEEGRIPMETFTINSKEEVRSTMGLSIP